MEWLYICLVILLLLLIFYFIILPIKIVNKLIYPKVKTNAEVIKSELNYKSFTLDEMKNYHSRVEKFKTSRDYSLAMEIFTPEISNQRNKVMIFTHGYTYAHEGNYRNAKFFLDLGYPCVLYDQRNHGNSDKIFTSIGYYEALDLKEIIDYTKKSLFPGCEVGTMGESMGAATALIEAGKFQDVVMIIEDCGYNNLFDLTKIILTKIMHYTPHLLTKVVNFYMSLKIKVSLKEISPIDSIKNCTNIPILFIHGTDDHFIPYQMGVEMYNKKQGIKELYLCDKANHALSYVQDPENYQKVVKAFIEKIGF